VVEVRLLGDRWHGSTGWPPSPFRLFQALIAAAYGGRRLCEEQSHDRDRAFRWLESLEPPIVLAPRVSPAATVPYFVPNNDLDAKGNDPRRTGEIRAKKILNATWVPDEAHLAYVWTFDDGVSEATCIAELSDRLHTFGRGLDAAYARGIIEDAAALRTRMASYLGSRSSPSTGSTDIKGSLVLECPLQGSLDSLHRRYAATRGRFARSGSGRGASVEFRQPPKADFRLVAYDRPPRQLLFEIRHAGEEQGFYPIRLQLATRVAKAVRDLTFERLAHILPDERTRDLLIIGRGTTDIDHSQRMRFIPLPSIGMVFTDASIRRILVELPPNCPFEEADVRWALAGQRMLIDRETGEVRDAILVPADDTNMLRHYNGGGSSRRWQTVTPAVLPQRRAKGRVSGRARTEYESFAAGSVVDALRHADVAAHAVDIRVQREPFFPRGRPVSEFDCDRFEAARLYHVEIVFADTVSGPLVIGNGRWLGLGIMRPVRSDDDAAVNARIAIEGAVDALEDDTSDSEELE